MGLEAQCSGIIDIIRREALYFEGNNGLTLRKDAVPTDFVSKTEEHRRILIETLSNVDDKIGDAYLSEKNVSEEEIYAAIRRAVICRKFVPVHLGSALKNKGIQPLLDGVVSYLPDPSEVENYATRVSDGEKIKLNPERSSCHPSVALAFKIESGTYGQLTHVRMYQGQVRRSEVLTNVRTGKRIKTPRLVFVHAKDLKETSVLSAGDIGAFFGLECNSGDTFIHEKAMQLTLESMYVPEPVMSLSVQAKSSDDMMKLANAFRKFQREDPTFRVHTDQDTRETIISGMGELHLEIYAQRLDLEYGVKIKVGKPKVSYRETLREAERFDYLHKRQTGGRGQYAHIIGRVEPLPPNQYELIEFVDETSGLAIPKNYIPSIQKGFYEACERGHLSGHKISGVRFVIETGEIHEVDSSDYAFRVATMSALKEIFMRKTGYVIEPIMKVEAVVPIENRTQLVRLINDRGGRVKDFEQTEDLVTYEAEVPLNNMFGFTTSLRQITQGKGEYAMDYSHYEEVPAERQEKLVSDFESTPSRAKK